MHPRGAVRTKRTREPRRGHRGGPGVTVMGPVARSAGTGPSHGVREQSGRKYRRSPGMGGGGGREVPLDSGEGGDLSP